jgi:hypothetical protein
MALLREMYYDSSYEEENEETTYQHLTDFVVLNKIATKAEIDLVMAIHCLHDEDLMTLGDIVYERCGNFLHKLYEQAHDKYSWLTLTDYDLYNLDCIDSDEYDRRRGYDDSDEDSEDENDAEDAEWEEVED